MNWEEKSSELLRKFEQILESESAIDEIGFVHPSQFVNLSVEAEASSSDSISNVVSSVDGSTVFWNRDQKLGISTDVLIALYKEAKRTMMLANQQYKALVESSEGASTASLDSDNGVEREVMKHSRAVLLVSSDYGTAWNLRKTVLLKKQELAMLLDELLFSSLVLSYAPKSEHAWCHRRWVIKLIAGKCSTLQEIVTKESELVEKIAEVHISKVKNELPCMVSSLLVSDLHDNRTVST